MRGSVRVAAMVAALGLCLAGFVGQASAAPGDLDPSFGVGGVVEARQAILQDHLRETAVGMAIGPQDEILALGAVPRSCSGVCPLELEVTRYSRHGSRDASFGSNGRAVLTVQPGRAGEVPGSAVAVDNDGRVVVATSDGSDIAVFRLTRDGALDTGFAGTGIVKTDLGGRDGAAAIAVRPDGAVIVAATRETPLEGFQSILVRYTASGVLDTGFGDGGTRVLGFAPGNYPVGLTLPGRNRIAVGLSDCCYSTGRALVARLDPSGALDNGFA
ncbi:MAG: delta-60 repeat domain-containing protein, partial [Solirubrobacterales bacterium]